MAEGAAAAAATATAEEQEGDWDQGLDLSSPGRPKKRQLVEGEGAAASAAACGFQLPCFMAVVYMETELSGGLCSAAAVQHAICSTCGQGFASLQWPSAVVSSARHPTCSGGPAALSIQALTC